MRTVIVSLLIAVLGAALGAGAAIYAGLYDVAATSLHWRATSWLLETARTRSIKAQAAWITAPPGLGDPANVILGVGHYGALRRLPRRARRPQGRYRAGALSAAAGSGESRVALHARRTVLDHQASASR